MRSSVFLYSKLLVFTDSPSMEFVARTPFSAKVIPCELIILFVKNPPSRAGLSIFNISLSIFRKLVSMLYKYSRAQAISIFYGKPPLIFGFIFAIVESAKVLGTLAAWSYFVWHT